MINPIHSRLKLAAIAVPVGAMLFHLLAFGKYFSGIVGLHSPWSLGPNDLMLGNMSFQCQPHKYSIEILSIDPFIMYINNFLSDVEIKHLLEFSHDRYQRFENEEKGKLVSDSKSTSVNERAPRFSWRDQVNVCLSERMKSLLGNVQHIETEPIRVVKYVGEDKIQVHYDWFAETRNEGGHPDMPARPNNRLGSIFAYIEDDCDGGETYFPEVEGVSDDADGDKFSRSESGRGLLVKPRRGNAIFWNNLHANGSGDTRTAHAGMPVRRGTKIGINIWSYYFLDSPILG